MAYLRGGWVGGAHDHLAAHGAQVALGPGTAICAHARPCHARTSVTAIAVSVELDSDSVTVMMIIITIAHCSQMRMTSRHCYCCHYAPSAVSRWEPGTTLSRPVQAPCSWPEPLPKRSSAPVNVITTAVPFLHGGTLRLPLAYHEEQASTMTMTWACIGFERG